ncbi:DUF5025 domain-containing protein [Pedobacter nutrimenti]|uniref:DUF5025 domain-containing protein n=1 Tax=Pedobacter nutrimenti TaxID=1241337 RepID=UPI00105F371A|nr:DUF5025 domain-containing protein [Pedobacter nutrimenti]
MKCTSTIVFLVIFAIIGISCEKNKKIDPEVDQQAQVFSQHFYAFINDKPVTVHSSLEKNRALFNGQWTGIGMPKGSNINLYKVNVVVPKEAFKEGYASDLKFQIYNISKKTFFITGKDDYYNVTGTYIAMRKKTGPAETDQKIYAANIKKKPFQVLITNYETIKGSLVPLVEGRLNGVLYNIKNPSDSVVIKNGEFKVRF